ncbi:unnamed protein product [Lactuca saligna]|uniref:Uncharacterized protein n=1 Tax=Lactuca saligna TaxID=75948 RepID=A0AA36A0I4_LACSI|nr:unnamed protein product [Lactuca saligna]
MSTTKFKSGLMLGGLKSPRQPRRVPSILLSIGSSTGWSLLPFCHKEECGKILFREVDQPWRISEDDIMERIQQVESEDILKISFIRCQRPRYTEPDQSMPILRDVMQHLLAA